MKKINKLAAVSSALFALCVYAAPSHAQATRTWVTGAGGSDANPCSRTAPCQTFAGAIVKTAVNGEINCIDPGGFGAVTITKSITIDCHDIFASILSTGTTGVTILFDSFAGTDTRKTVRLRNLNINGAETGLRGIRIVGSTNSAGSEVHVEDTLVDGFFGSPGRGISDERVNGGKLFVANSTFRNLAGAGIITFPTSGTTRIDSSIVGTRVSNVQAGFAVLNGGKMVVTNSVTSGNSIGIDVEGTGAELVADQVTVSGNTTGILTVGAGVFRLSNSSVLFNTTGISGTVNSFSNNRFVGNGAGGTLTPIAPLDTNPSGLQ